METKLSQSSLHLREVQRQATITQDGKSGMTRSYLGGGLLLSRELAQEGREVFHVLTWNLFSWAYSTNSLS
jgi:hypothetical protein